VIVMEGAADARRPLLHLGKTDVYALVLTLPEGTALRWAYEVDGIRRREGEVAIVHWLLVSTVGSDRLLRCLGFVTGDLWIKRGGCGTAPTIS